MKQKECSVRSLAPFLSIAPLRFTPMLLGVSEAHPFYCQSHIPTVGMCQSVTHQLKDTAVVSSCLAANTKAAINTCMPVLSEPKFSFLLGNY